MSAEHTHRCCECDCLVDLDADSDALEDGEVTCLSCREDAEMQEAEDHRLDDPRHGLADELNRRPG